jgi:cytochrome c oxidase subunit 3
VKNPFADLRHRFAAGRMGLAIFLVSLAVLFAATVVGFVIVRLQLQRDGLWPTDLPGLPWWLGPSTLVLMASSGSMHFVQVAAQRGEGSGGAEIARGAGTSGGAAPAVVIRLALTLLLGVLFLAIQALAWREWTVAVHDRWDGSEGWRFALSGFYVLTGLHGLHVLGGLVALAVTLARAVGVRPHRGAPELAHAVRGCATYWHFLGAVWLALVGLMIVA